MSERTFTMTEANAGKHMAHTAKVLIDTVEAVDHFIAYAETVADGTHRKPDLTRAQKKAVDKAVKEANRISAAVNELLSKLKYLSN
jgi:hypothetical protein